MASPVPATLAFDSSGRASCPAPSAERDRTGRGGAQLARRLTRELDLLEASLLAAEQAAMSCRPTRSGHDRPDSDHDIASRRAELDRRELTLRQRERALDEQRRLLDHTHDRLVRSKESLKRAICRFRAHVAEQMGTLDAREQRVGTARAELIQNRRALARDQMHLKRALRRVASDG